MFDFVINVIVLDVFRKTSGTNSSTIIVEQHKPAGQFVQLTVRAKDHQQNHGASIGTQL